MIPDPKDSRFTLPLYRRERVAAWLGFNPNTFNGWTRGDSPLVIAYLNKCLSAAR